MSNIYKLNSGGGGGGSVNTLTGNTGGAVSPTANNINIVGPGGITVTGNPGTSTLTITPSETVITATATTTGFTTATMSNGVPVPTNSTVSIRANIAGYDTTANLATGGELIGSAKNVAGTVTIVAVPDKTKNSDTNLNDTNWTLIVVGTSAFIQVTGTANGGADVIQWRAIMDIVTAP